LLIFAYAVPD
jgi:hypothetical protein